MKLKGREMGGFDQSVLHACISFSNNKRRGKVKEVGSAVQAFAMQAAMIRTGVQVPRTQGNFV